jgi:hypothetical protein
MQKKPTCFMQKQAFLMQKKSHFMQKKHILRKKNLIEILLTGISEKCIFMFCWVAHLAQEM